MFFKASGELGSQDSKVMFETSSLEPDHLASNVGAMFVTPSRNNLLPHSVPQFPPWAVVRYIKELVEETLTVVPDNL